MRAYHLTSLACSDVSLSESQSLTLLLRNECIIWENESLITPFICLHPNRIQLERLVQAHACVLISTVLINTN